MKKFQFSIIAMAIVAVGLVYSCTKRDAQVTTQKDDVKESSAISHERTSSVALEEDENFIALANDMYEFLRYVKDVTDRQSLDLANLETAFRDLQARELPYADQLSQINQIFKEDVTARLTQHMSIFSANWRVLKEKYEDLSQLELEEACGKVLTDRIAAEPQATGKCGWRYSLCVVGVTAGAILCHAGCDTTALATTAGLGIPACVALCGAVQVAGGVACYDNYCD